MPRFFITRPIFAVVIAIRVMLAELMAIKALPKMIGALPPGIEAILKRHVSNQEMIVEAALRGSRLLALQALLNDPLVKDITTAPRMLDELIQANQQYLPQF